MRIGWSVPLPGPFRIGGTVWRSKRRRVRRRTRWSSPLYWLTGLALLELSVWLLWGCLWLTGAACQCGFRAGMSVWQRRG